MRVHRSACFAAAVVFSAVAAARAASEPDDRLTGNWGGARDRWSEKGFDAQFSLTYVFQSVVEGGLHGPVFRQFSDESDNGNTLWGDLQLDFDTQKLGLWHGGEFNLRVDGRAGRSVIQRAGSVSAVNNAALFPNVINDFDEGAIAVTEIVYTQRLTEKFAVFGGLMNTAAGDDNALAGSALSNAHFLNSAMLYSLVEDATTPNVSPGGGIEIDPTENLTGSFSIFGTHETAGHDPFDHFEGTTFSTEWTLSHELFGKAGGQTFGALYGIDAHRTDIAADPRLALGNVLTGHPIPDTTADTWSIYYNAYQYVQGDENGGWGLFVRFGVSDGNPNPVRWNAAGGVSGIGLFPNREHDRWGVGAFYLNFSDEDLLSGLNVSDEVGGEAFYNIAFTPWLHVTLDAQVIDPGVPRADTVWVLGVRTHLDF